MPEWTHVTDADAAAVHLPAWFGNRMIGARGRFGLLLATGDVVRATSIAAAHLSSAGLALLDVLLDHAGVPDGVDLAWQSKHFLGAPVPGASLATINLAHVLAIIEFTASELAEATNGPEALTSIDEMPDLDRDPVPDAATPDALESA